MIYLDNAATTKTSKAAIEVMLKYMNQTYGNPSSLHSVGQAAAEAIKSAIKDYYDKNGIDYDEKSFPDCSHCENCKMI